MPGIRESTQVAAPVDRVREAWPAFVEWGLVGPQRLTCSEVACVNTAQQGTVAFKSDREDATCVVFQLDLERDDRVVTEGQLAHDMHRALLMFKEYVERHSSPPPRRRQGGQDSPDSSHKPSPETARPASRA